MPMESVVCHNAYKKKFGTGGYRLTRFCLAHKIKVKMLPCIKNIDVESHGGFEPESRLPSTRDYCARCARIAVLAVQGVLLHAVYSV